MFFAAAGTTIVTQQQGYIRGCRRSSAWPSTVTQLTADSAATTGPDRAASPDPHRQYRLWSMIEEDDGTYEPRWRRSRPRLPGASGRWRRRGPTSQAAARYRRAAARMPVLAPSSSIAESASAASGNEQYRREVLRHGGFSLSPGSVDHFVKFRDERFVSALGATLPISQHLSLTRVPLFIIAAADPRTDRSSSTGVPIRRSLTLVRSTCRPTSDLPRPWLSRGKTAGHGHYGPGRRLILPAIGEQALAARRRHSSRRRGNCRSPSGEGDEVAARAPLRRREKRPLPKLMRCWSDSVGIHHIDLLAARAVALEARSCLPSGEKDPPTSMPGSRSAASPLHAARADLVDVDVAPARHGEEQGAAVGRPARREPRHCSFHRATRCVPGRHCRGRCGRSCRCSSHRRSTCSRATSAG